MDPRQILAGFLTVTMFVMLANMIKRDHFDSVSTFPLLGCGFLAVFYFEVRCFSWVLISFSVS